MSAARGKTLSADNRKPAGHLPRGLMPRPLRECLLRYEQTVNAHGRRTAPNKHYAGRSRSQRVEASQRADYP
jgi:hypothetical protein